MMTISHAHRAWQYGADEVMAELNADARPGPDACGCGAEATQIVVIDESVDDWTSHVETQCCDSCAAEFVASGQAMPMP